MKPSQRVRYAQRIEKVAAHLSAALRAGEVPDLSRLAQIAALSPCHFHRVFRLMTGETPIAMVRRLRLAAGEGALSGDKPVVEAAAVAGYSTSQSFARALSRKTLSMHSSASPAPITIEVVSLEPFTVAALRNVGDYAELNRGFARLYALLPDPGAITGLYGIPYDDPQVTPASECQFDCCMKLLPGFEPTQGDAGSIGIEGGRYASAHQQGDYDQCWETLDRLYAAIIDDLDAEIDDAPPFIHYYDDPDTKPVADLRANVYVRIRETGA